MPRYASDRMLTWCGDDIDYMRSYRDFENDPVNYPYEKGAAFLKTLHENKQHYVPIIDAGIYVPIPGNETDEYLPFSRGLEQDAFVFNPDGSLYIGEVWPGYCGKCSLLGRTVNFPANDTYASLG